MRFADFQSMTVGNGNLRFWVRIFVLISINFDAIFGTDPIEPAPFSWTSMKYMCENGTGTPNLTCYLRNAYQCFPLLSVSESCPKEQFPTPDNSDPKKRVIQDVTNSGKQQKKKRKKSEREISDAWNPKSGANQPFVDHPVVAVRKLVPSDMNRLKWTPKSKEPKPTHSNEPKTPSPSKSTRTSLPSSRPQSHIPVGKKVIVTQDMSWLVDIGDHYIPAKQLLPPNAKLIGDRPASKVESRSIEKAVPKVAPMNLAHFMSLKKVHISYDDIMAKKRIREEQEQMERNMRNVTDEAVPLKNDENPVNAENMNLSPHSNLDDRIPDGNISSYPVTDDRSLDGNLSEITSSEYEAIDILRISPEINDENDTTKLDVSISISDILKNITELKQENRNREILRKIISTEPDSAFPAEEIALQNSILRQSIKTITDEAEKALDLILYRRNLSSRFDLFGPPLTNYEGKFDYVIQISESSAVFDGIEIQGEEYNKLAGHEEGRKGQKFPESSPRLKLSKKSGRSILPEGSFLFEGKTPGLRPKRTKTERGVEMGNCVEYTYLGMKSELSSLEEQRREYDIIRNPCEYTPWSRFGPCRIRYWSCRRNRSRSRLGQREDCFYTWEEEICSKEKCEKETVTEGMGVKVLLEYGQTAALSVLLTALLILIRCEIHHFHSLAQLLIRVYAHLTERFQVPSSETVTERPN